MMSVESAMSGRIGANAPDERQIVLRRVLAVHRCENAIRAGLERQMQIRHQLFFVPMRCDEVVAHIARMACHVAEPRKALDLGQMADEARKRPRFSVGSLAVIAVDVLAEQRDFADAAIDETAHFIGERRHRPRKLHAARIGHDAERTELVAAFLHGEKRALPWASAGGGRAWNLSSSGNAVSMSSACRCARFGKQIRQAMIALRSEHEIDRRCAAHDLSAFRLRPQPATVDEGLLAGFRAQGLGVAKTSEIGIDLLRRLLANMTRC